MKPSKSINSLASQQQHQQQLTFNGHRRTLEMTQASSSQLNQNQNLPTSPICRCRVMYLGSSVPHITKDGLQGIQEPLRELYPDKASLASGNAGIDSWLSVWSNGILIENVDETGRELKRFFKIESLHYCAAVKFIPQVANCQINPYTTLPNGNISALPKFLPLDSPHARQLNNPNPPLFASILRRTTGVKVLECHAFICKREAAANALVRCCFHAYADTMYAKQIGADVDKISSDLVKNKAVNEKPLNFSQKQSDANIQSGKVSNGPLMISRRSKSIAALNDSSTNSQETWAQPRQSDHNIDNYHQPVTNGCIVRRKSINDNYAIPPDNTSAKIASKNNLQKNKFSKSMHHLNNQDQLLGNSSGYDHTWNTHQIGPMNILKNQPFYDPQASRVPSYPPQDITETNGGTLKSVRSIAATSIASTLLRSKKHAKAMAQANQEKIMSFHQNSYTNVPTFGGQSMIMPPVPPMFLPNNRPILNGSQTMKASSRSMVHLAGPPINFEAMTPKEMKKMLKKSAKYGIDPSKFAENGLPLLPLRPPKIPPSLHMPPQSKSGTIGSQSLYSVDVFGNDVTDMANGYPISRLPPMPIDPMEQPRPILVKPNPDFLKSKAGKKWLKQQKEFKKLLPPHLDELPIVFGPPPIEALEPSPMPNSSFPPPAFIAPHMGLPVMDSSGYYNPHSFYGPSGRASAASTLLRYSPNSQMIHEITNNINGQNLEYAYGNQVAYPNNIGLPQMTSNLGDSMNDGSMIFGANDRHPSSNRRNKRNHMVEQSVISLGDENDYDDEEESRNGNNINDNNSGYYQSATFQNGHRPRSQKLNHRELNNNNHEHITSNYQDSRTYSQPQEYEQLTQQNEDQSSYSSGIYRRGHINERAFSYSIRQEHRSSMNTNSDVDCRNGKEAPINNRQSDPEYQTNGTQQYQNERDDMRNEIYHNGSQSIPVNELTNRLESQLNMKSFSNSRIKSHM